MPNQKPMWTRCLGGFSVMWVTKLLIFPVEIRIFCPKTTKFGPKLAFLVNLGQAMQAYSMPSWWVGWWFSRAGCISQDTYLLYVFKLWGIKCYLIWCLNHKIMNTTIGEVCFIFLRDKGYFIRTYQGKPTSSLTKFYRTHTINFLNVDAVDCNRN